LIITMRGIKTAHAFTVCFILCNRATAYRAISVRPLTTLDQSAGHVYIEYNLHFSQELTEMTSPLSRSLNDTVASRLPSLAEVAYIEVRDAILSGALKAGETIGQQEIALQIGTSRVPLREALQRLEAEGLVVLRPRRGYIVTSLDPDEIKDIFEIRMMLEERAGYLATQRATPQDVADLEQLLHTMDDISVTNAEEAARFANQNRAFHDRLFQGSGRPQLCRLMAMLRTNVERYIRIGAMIAGNLDRVRDDHYQIFYAFKRGDALTVARLCREHCEATCERLIARLAQEGTESAVSGPKKK
jgi:DNA-binding GntR family transcriptional regulator